MAKIFSKRSKHELDMELYELTSKVLISVPDISTLWNIRRECILNMPKNKTQQELFEKDLAFTEQCLRVQPKSYSTWHHRCWTLESQSNANWQKEVALCTQYLKADIRNFHCWEYRRYVVEKAQVPAEKELEFCTDKIEENFSNYSAWHYRSQLLPKLFPHEDKSRPISEAKLKEELILVLNAAFTEPNDSSAWFYQRWLLGYSQPEFDIAVFKMTTDQVLVAFSQPINLPNEGKFHGTPFDDFLNGHGWKSNEKCDTIWTLEHNCNIAQVADFEIEFQRGEKSAKMYICRVIDGLVGIKVPKFGYDFQSAVLDVLKSQLNDCHELLQLEPDSKWTLLTSALLMRAINRKDKDYHTKSLEHLRKLETIDYLRAGYYQDLASRWNIEQELERWISAGNLKGQLNLSNLKLTTLYYEQYMCAIEDINLSKNSLQDKHFEKMKNFTCCKKLDISKNVINSLKNFPNLPDLKELKVDGNGIPNEEVEDLLSKIAILDDKDSN